ncbi:unnamed protein product [Symbiodinium microadriaticum]|nr:unnamed protein product [Symbiodinium microadriaticum]
MEPLEILKAIRKLAGDLSPNLSAELQDRVESVLIYHFRSKHFLDVQASLPGELDWSSQPSPWRSYHGAPRAQLPHSLDVLEAASSPVPLSLASLGAFLRLGAGLSAWKSYDGLHMWALRVMPSSGNLQTTEFHVVLPPLDGLAAVTAVYHFQPEMHALEFRLPAPNEFVTTADGSAGFLVVLTSLCIREAWKYGERALRSCHLNLGHAVGALDAACNVFGWSLEGGPPALHADSVLRTVLGLGAGSDEEPAEHPELALFVRTSGRASDVGVWPAYLTAETIGKLYQEAHVEAQGVPGPLRPLRLAAAPSWPAMDAAQEGAVMALAEVGHQEEPMSRGLERSALTLGPDSKGVPQLAGPSGKRLLGQRLLDAILNRRSVLRMSDEQPPVPEADFLRSLGAFGAGAPGAAEESPRGLRGRAGAARRPSGSWRGLRGAGDDVLEALDLVESFLPGLYVLTRARGSEEELFAFVKATPERVQRSESGSPLDLPEGCALWALARPVDVRHATQISACGQEVAGTGSFAAAFFGAFTGWRHPRRYLELLWHAGALGHVFYLAAEAAGFGATGMGCFMDDMALGLLRDPWSMEAKGDSSSQSFSAEESQLQVLYYVTVGKASSDPRLLSFDPYQHLQEGFSYEALQGGMGRIFQTT